MKDLRMMVLCLLLTPLGVTAAQAAGFTCEPRFQPAKSNRFMPHVFFDQAMASIETLYPEHALLASRRSSSIAGVDYSLLAYKERGDAAAVRIEGAAVFRSRSWTFDLACPATHAMGGLLTLLEQIADLKDLPREVH